MGILWSPSKSEAILIGLKIHSKGGQVVGEYLSICKMVQRAFQGPTFYCVWTPPLTQLCHFKTLSDGHLGGSVG